MYARRARAESRSDKVAVQCLLVVRTVLCYAQLMDQQQKDDMTHDYTRRKRRQEEGRYTELKNQHQPPYVSLVDQGRNAV